MENEELIINEGVNENIEPTPEPEPFVIPDIYNYKPDTKEFTGIVEKADKDSAKSAQVGYFVPLVHANATLLEPPTVEENQIQIYSKEVIEHKEVDEETGEEIITYEIIENWNIEPDYRKNFYKVDENLNVYDIDTIGEQTGYILVDKETGNDIKIHKDWYKIIDGVDIEVVKKTDEEIAAIELNKAKLEKIEGNDYLRDSALNAGVEYKNILFDSDTDQKVNLLATISLLDDETTVVWFGIYNQPLECTKADLINIGGLITELHTFCWTKNAEIKAAINAAETIAELEAIDIDYSLPDEVNDANPTD